MINFRYFMMDVETTGVQILKDKVLQIGILEMIKKNDIFEGGRELIIDIGEISNSFHKKYLSDLYKRCKHSKYTPKKARKRILKFFEECGVSKGDVVVPVDIGSLVTNHILKEGFYKEEEGEQDKWSEGDVSFQYIWDIEGMVFKEATKTGKTPSEIVRIYAPNEQMAHDALMDCKYQLKLLNNLLINGDRK